nr:hypothetical protein TFERT_g7 [Trichoderma cf. fertile]
MQRWSSSKSHGPPRIGASPLIAAPVTVLLVQTGGAARDPGKQLVRHPGWLAESLTLDQSLSESHPAAACLMTDPDEQAPRPKTVKGGRGTPANAQLAPIKNLRSPSSGQLGLARTSGAVAFGPAKLGPRLEGPEGLGDRPCLFPKASTTNDHFQIFHTSATTRTYWTWVP